MSLAEIELVIENNLEIMEPGERSAALDELTALVHELKVKTEQESEISDGEMLD